VQLIIVKIKISEKFGCDIEIYFPWGNEENLTYASIIQQDSAKNNHRTEEKSKRKNFRLTTKEEIGRDEGRGGGRGG